MKRTRSETMQNPKTQEEANSKSQRRYRSPKCPQIIPKIKTEDNSPTTPEIAGEVAGDLQCSASPNGYPEDPLYVLWDELSGVWPMRVEEDVLSGWYPFVEGHFREFVEDEGVDLHDLWRLNDIFEPNMNYPEMMYDQFITPLVVSVLNGSMKCTQLLIKAGADVNKQPMLDMALGSTELLKYLLQCVWKTPNRSCCN